MSEAARDALQKGTFVKSHAAILYGTDQDLVIDEITVDDPKEGELLIKVAASGICHSDHHLVTGHHGPLYFPMLGGHEGAGTVIKAGPGASRFKEGDHVMMTFIPACGHCRFCAMGKSYLCDNGAGIMLGPQLDGTFRLHDSKGRDVGQFCLLGSFSEYVVIPAMSAVKLDPEFDMTKVCIFGCATPTGFGAAVNSADVQPGETVVVYGIGGVGINAVQGAALKGAAQVIAVDPVDFKLETALKLGATHAVNPRREDPIEKVQQLTNYVGADKAIITIDLVTPEDVGRAFNSTRKGGRTVLTGVAHIDYDHINVSPWILAMWKKELVGSLYGDSAVRADIPRYLELYKAGKLKVDELITRTYRLDQINDAIKDMLEGKNIRGVILYD